MSTKKPPQDKNQRIALSKQDFWAEFAKDIEAGEKFIREFKEKGLAELARNVEIAAKKRKQFEERYWEERLWEKQLAGDQNVTQKKARRISGLPRQEQWPKDKREIFHQLLIMLSEKGFIADSSLEHWKEIFEGDFSDHMKECSGPHIKWLRSIAAYKLLYDSCFRDLHELGLLSLTNDKGIFWEAHFDDKRERTGKRTQVHDDHAKAKESDRFELAIISGDLKKKFSKPMERYGS